MDVTRNRLLRNELQGVQYKPGTRDCKVIAGRLDPDPYTGNTVDLKQVAIDHIVSVNISENVSIFPVQSLDYMPLTMVDVVPVRAAV